MLSERSKSLQWLAGALFASMDGSLRDRRTIILEKEGLRSSSAREEGWIPWKSIQSIEEHGGQILLYFDHLSYVPVPGSVFADDRKTSPHDSDLPFTIHHKHRWYVSSRDAMGIS
jgi:hypothetical protein